MNIKPRSTGKPWKTMPCRRTWTYVPLSERESLNSCFILRHFDEWQSDFITRTLCAFTCNIFSSCVYYFISMVRHPAGWSFPCPMESDRPLSPFPRDRIKFLAECWPARIQRTAGEAVSCSHSNRPRPGIKWFPWYEYLPRLVSGTCHVNDSRGWGLLENCSGWAEDGEKVRRWSEKLTSGRDICDQLLQRASPLVNVYYEKRFSTLNWTLFNEQSTFQKLVTLWNA